VLLTVGPICLVLVASGCGGSHGSHPAGLVRTPFVVAAGAAGPPFEVPRTLLLPAGWRAEVWARVDGARFAVWTPDGRLLVSVPTAGEVLQLEPSADPSAPPLRRVLLSGLTEPQGLAFDVRDGRPILYVAEPGQIDQYTWSGLRRTVIARGLPDADGLDRLKGIAVGPDHTIYIGVGSESLGRGPRGVILAVRPNSARRIVARGVHNAEGLAVDPAGHLWAAVNSVGDLPDEVDKLASGRALPERRLPPHSAPLGFNFLPSSTLPAPWRDGAVLAVHGAGDLASPSRPAVLWLPWNGQTLGAPTTLARGFQQGRTRWGRPTDAVAGPDGSLYVVDDTAGAIYRLTPR
jgi:glucose/arabinose dehydrogenase